ncbi:MAG: sigma-70 family RNA polymerase sigma factor [Nannocystaceae bacterium]
MNDDPARDSSLYVQWRSGVDEAGRSLIERHFDDLLFFFDCKVSARDAEDLASETVARCIEARARIRGDSSFRTFLLSIARNVLYEHYRRRRRDEPLDFTTHRLADLSPTPSSIADANQRVKLLLQALQCLPIETQLIVELSYFQGLKSADVARVMDRPAGTIRRILHDAKVELRKRISGALRRRPADAPRRSAQPEPSTSSLVRFKAALEAAANELYAPTPVPRP